MFPWLQILDALIGVTDLARSRKIRTLSRENAELNATSQIDARLEIERERIAAERLRAERALKLERRRQAGDHEIGRLRWLAGTAVASWLGTLLVVGRVIASHTAARVALGGGWALLLGALAASFAAQSHVVSRLNRDDDAEIDAGVAGALAPWLIVMGLAVVGVALLV